MEDAFEALPDLFENLKCDESDGSSLLIMRELHTELQNLPKTQPPQASPMEIRSTETKPNEEGEAARLYRENLRLVARYICHMCYNEKANHVLIPCGHLALCLDCATSKTCSNYNCCPICDMSVVNMVHVYQ